MNVRVFADTLSQGEAVAPSRRHFALRRWLPIGLASIVLAALALAALLPLPAALREETHVIPPGTWARRSAGQDIEILPSTINLQMGVRDILVLVNNDDVPQLFGPVLMMPGQSFRLPFNVASEYQFTCTAHVSGFLTVVVAAPPPWWEMLLLRLRTNVDPATWRLAST